MTVMAWRGQAATAAVGLLPQAIRWVLDGDGHLVGADVEDRGSGLDAQRMALAQLTIDLNSPTIALGGHVRPSSNFDRSIKLYGLSWIPRV